MPKVYTTPLKMALKNCHFDRVSKHNILSAAAHICTLFVPKKARRRPEHHMNLICVSSGYYVKTQKQFHPKDITVSALKKTFAKSLASLIIFQFIFEKR